MEHSADRQGDEGGRVLQGHQPHRPRAALLSGTAIRFALNDEAGKPISGSYMRDATALCKPLDLKPSASADVSFQATLFYGTDRSSLCLRQYSTLPVVI